MKRLSIIMLAGFMLMFIASDLYPVQTSDKIGVSFRQTGLTTSEVKLRLVSEGVYSAPMTIKTRITRNGRLIAFGARPLEVLSIPATGLDYQIPLSKSLRQNAEYDVEISLTSSAGNVLTNSNKQLVARPARASNFFDRNFNPLRQEAGTMRTAISRTGIKEKMGLN